MTYTQAVQYYLSQNPGVGLSTPEEQQAFNNWSASLGPGGFESFTPPGQAAPFAGHADLQAAYDAALRANTNLSWEDFAVEWANANPNDPRLDDPQFASSLGLELETGPAVNAEQALGDYALQQGQADILRDAERKKEAEQILAGYQPTFDAARGTIADMYPTVPGQNSAMLNSELAASDAAAKAQTDALNAQLATLSGSLTGELAAKAANIQNQVASLTAGLGTFTAAERTSLAQQVASQFQALDQEVAARRQALTAQLSTMGSAISAHDVAMRTALQAELGQLNAAQEPLNAARISGAQTIASSINLGAQAQQDRVRADAAQAGYVGSSTGTDMAIARAAIGGRQGAAEAMSNATIQNATDTAGIARYGANTEFNIAAGTAGANRDLGFYGAGENRTVSDYGAAGTRGISDFSSTGVRTIDNNANTGNLNISNFGAGETRTLGDYGATARKATTDFGAGEKRNISDTAAGRGLSLFSNDLQRRLAALSLPAQAVQQEFKVRGMADSYGQSGFDRTMNNLNYFRTNAGAAPSMATFTGNTGIDNGLDNLGAGIVSAAGGIAKANNYWASPKTTGPTIDSSGLNPIT
jgi:hypothetical protein